jgi:Putative prokaryotic signal transducing protein
VEEIIRTPDPVLVTAIEVLFAEAGISVFVADRHISAIEARINAFPMRIMVPSDVASRARRLIEEAGLGAELRPPRKTGR